MENTQQQFEEDLDNAYIYMTRLRTLQDILRGSRITNMADAQKAREKYKQVVKNIRQVPCTAIYLAQQMLDKALHEIHEREARCLHLFVEAVEEQRRLGLFTYPGDLVFEFDRESNTSQVYASNPAGSPGYENDYVEDYPRKQLDLIAIKSFELDFRSLTRELKFVDYYYNETA